MLNWWRWSLTGRYIGQERKPTRLEVLKCVALVTTDLAILFSITITLYAVLIWRAVQPTQIGFACGDQTIRNPFKKSTVPTKLLLAVVLGSPFFVVGLASLIFHRKALHAATLIATIRYTAFVYYDYVIAFWVSNFYENLFCSYLRLLDYNRNSGLSKVPCEPAAAQLY